MERSGGAFERADGDRVAGAVPARPRRGGAAAFEFEVAPGQAGELLSSAEGTKISIEDVDWGVTGAEGMGDL